jgi:hypothetical protein
MYVQPSTVARPITAQSTASVMQAAVRAASSTGWTPRTISPETGFMLADREVRVVARAGRNDSYKLELVVPKTGRGEVTAKVTPPPGVVGGESPQTMANEYLDALARALGR